MQVKFLDSDNIIDLTINFTKNKQVDFLKDDITIGNERVPEDKTISEVEELQTNILNSLNYVSNEKLLPSTLPEQLNIKFLNISKLDKLKDKIIPSSIAQLESPNTMYVSTDLLPQNQPNSKKYFIAKLYDKFQNPQQVLDFIVFHELGHLVFNNSFNGLTDFNNELLKARNGTDRFKSWFREDYTDLPLYQINRSLEEHFADSYSAIILSKRYGVLPEEYINIRNGNDVLGITRTKRIDINITRLDDTFKKPNEINYENDRIDKSIIQLYKIALSSSKEIMNNHLKLVRTDDILNRLKDNLKSFGITVDNSRNAILNKSEELIINKSENNNEKSKNLFKKF